MLSVQQFLKSTGQRAIGEHFGAFLHEEPSAKRNLGIESCHIFTRVLLTLLHSERPKLYAILAFLSAVGLREL